MLLECLVNEESERGISRQTKVILTFKYDCVQNVILALTTSSGVRLC